MDKNRRRASSRGGNGNEGASVVLPHDLVGEEVLTRLPAKSLMRFKCVSKVWCSTIVDPSFAKAHRSRSLSHTGLFITNPDTDSFCCSYATLPCSGKSTLVHQFTVPLCKYDGASQVINGLCCLHAYARAALFNVATREIMEFQLPPSDLSPFLCYDYFLGYASTSKEYKLLKVCWYAYGFHTESECEILTLGKDAAWKSLSDPEINLAMLSIYTDRAVYFCITYEDGFVAFDFTKESFLRIPPAPSREEDFSLHQFGGHLGVVCWLEDDQKYEMWVLELGYEEDGRPLFNWVSLVIEDIPDDLNYYGCGFHGNLPTGELFISDLHIHEHLLRGYSYDHTKRKFENFVAMPS